MRFGLCRSAITAQDKVTGGTKSRTPAGGHHVVAIAFLGSEGIPALDGEQEGSMRRHPRCGVGSEGSNRPLMWRFVGCLKFEGRDALAPVFGGSCRDKGQTALAVAGHSRPMWRPGGSTRFWGRKLGVDSMSDMKYTSFVIASRVKSILRHQYRDNVNPEYKGKYLVIDIESREYVINHCYPG